MKLVVVRVYVRNVVTFTVWVEDHVKVGDYIPIKGFGSCVVIEILDGQGNTLPEEPATEPEFDTVEAVEIKVGDYIWYNNSKWAKVTNAYNHTSSARMKFNVIPEDAAESYAKYRNSGIYYPLYKGDKVRRRREKVNMSIALISASDLTKSLQAKLIDFAAWADAPERVEVMPTVFVNKMPVMVALKQGIKEDYVKLGDALKKL